MKEIIVFIQITTDHDNSYTKQKKKKNENWSWFLFHLKWYNIKKYLAICKTKEKNE